jgi:DNA polymerase elongation subunit (family B)
MMAPNFSAFTKDLLVIDIETVSAVQTHDRLDKKMQELWDKKSSFFRDSGDMTAERLYEEKSAIYAEFGKVVCIAAGFFIEDHHGPGLRVKGFYSDDESEILTAFKNLVEEKFNARSLRLVAHNGKEFDFPYLCRRMLINSIDIPDPLDIRGKKPWEVPHIDTMELWKFGDYKHYTSLDLLAAIFGIGSSKDDIDGSMIHDVYYKENDLGRIAQYCKKDVVVTAQLLLRLYGLPVVPDDQVHLLPD